MASRRSKGSSAFTLIEVLVSVVILSIVGIALLDIANKNTKTIAALNNKKEVPMMLSIAGFQGNPDLDNLEKNLYDIVSKEYRIESSFLKNHLNAIKVLYKEEEIEKADFATGGGGTNQIAVYKQSIKTEKNGGFLYTVRTVQ